MSPIILEEEETSQAIAPVIELSLDCPETRTDPGGQTESVCAGRAADEVICVVAHHIVGNTIQDWPDDISLASKHNIDGFALNIGTDSWQPDCVADAYQAALQSGLDFKLFLSLDMSSLPCASHTDAQALRSLVLKFAGHPNQLGYSKVSPDPLPLWNGAWPVELTTASQGSSDTSLSSALTDLLGLSGSTSAPDATNIIPHLSTFLGGFLRGSSDDTNSPNSNVASKQTTDVTQQTQAKTLASALSKFIGSTDGDLLHVKGLGLTGVFPSKRWLASSPSESDNESTNWFSFPFQGNEMLKETKDKQMKKYTWPPSLRGFYPLWC
ncbi:hypothetical protein D9758_015098 [Tetrapyrgos nigripes]|uniref:Uncharacterized protein n=1 Tax=Tetrapyrgos nigripes TaxID=182062 RepID=A0A8H5FD42_9AGAR|nr:hypothetical protein D9758_015098 [Tetrapyrgos nigripes]